MPSASTRPHSIARLVVVALRVSAVLLFVLSLAVGAWGVIETGELAPAFVAAGIAGVVVAFWHLVFAVFIERRTAEKPS